MFGRAPKPVVFEPYGRRRSRRGVPRWLILLLAGVAAGAGGVIYVQERHLPPRLSAREAAELRAAFERAESERQRLKTELDGSSQRLAAALADQQGAAGELAASRDSVERLRGDLAAAVAALPPDPRGGAIAVRAGKLTQQGATLAYELVLSRERAGGKAFAGLLQLVVAGEAARGGETAVSLPPVAVTLERFASLRGRLPLPEGFKPRQATVKVVERAGGEPVGLRVLYVQ